VTDFTARPEDKFSFGLWTIGNRGRDPFGEAVRPKIEITDMLKGLADLGVYGVSFHDDDLMTFGAPESERRAELDAFKRTLDETGLVCSMATTNLFYHPVFKDGAFTSNDPQVRRYAIQKSMRNIDVAAELGAPIYVFWGGREGVESAAATPRPSTSSPATSRTSRTTSASRSSRSRTSPAATSSCRPSGTRSPSSPRSTTTRWSA
jgi:xylose isomerase